MEYRRCQGKSYMILKSESAGLGYQMPMLRENRVKGVLPVQRVYEGEEVQFWYDISGKHDLEGYARFHKLGRDFLGNFILSLNRTAQNLGEYLLLEDELCLEPDRIYLNYNEKEISFCYIPGNKKSLESSLGNFMEFFLKHMEHGAQQDIEICYKIYEKSQEEHVRLSDLAELAAQGLSREEKNFKPEEPDIREECEIQQEREEVKKRQKERCGFIKNGFYAKKKILSQWMMDKRNRSKGEEEQFIFEPQEPEEEVSNPTVFLGSERKEILGELRYEGDGRGRNFKIDVPVFLVGSQDGEANGVIFTSSVSRHHALIYREEENYFIEDLNSTNGTYLNGEALGYKEKVPLSKNDKVRFADEAYRFV